jgi:hypothetical protein
MSEQITITLSLEQAEAVVDAITCLTLAARGELDIVTATYAPDGKTDDYRRSIADTALEVSATLQDEIVDAYRRNPDFQELLHRIKMHGKHGVPDDD